MRTGTLTHRPVRAEDTSAALGLLTRVMGGGPTGRRTADFFDWKHRQSPFGESLGRAAFDGNRLVGLRMLMRWEFSCSGTTLRAVRAVDTVTDPEYQRRGVFRSLNDALLTQVDDEGIDLVFNTPNADSRPANLSMGWSDAGRAPIRICPVRPVRFVRGMRAAARATSNGSAAAVAGDEAVRPVGVACTLAPAAWMWTEPDLLKGLAPLALEGSPSTPRRRAYLRWRYCAPGLDYRCVPVRDGDRVVGVGFGRVRRRASLVELTLGDVLVRPGASQVAARVLRAARRSGADHVALHTAAGSPLARIAPRAGYFKAPGGVGLLVNARSDRGEQALRALPWDLSLGDLEVF